MSRVRTKDILIHATQNKYGVASINAFSYDSINWIITAAEREKIPVIVMVPPGFDKWVPIRFLSHMAKDLADRAAVPVAIHLDHSKSYDIAIGGIRDGFPSIMVDGSALPFEENVVMTSAVVKTARVFNIDVEAELGHVGMGSNLDDIVNSDNYTSVEQAMEFVQRTGCDSLAIAVGNAHGAYIKEPNLDFDRIKAIRAKLAIPLVLHGCSGIPDEQIQQSVNLGMSKFNIFTEFDAAVYQSYKHAITKIAEGGNPDATYFRNVLPELGEPVVDFLRSRLRLLNPNKITV